MSEGESRRRKGKARDPPGRPGGGRGAQRGDGGVSGSEGFGTGTDRIIAQSAVEGRGQGGSRGGDRAGKSGGTAMRGSTGAAWLLVATMILAASPADAGLKKKPLAEAPRTPPETALRAYVDRVRAQQAAEVRTAGSIWSPNGQLVRLGTDVKAFRIHDV